jgi:hypothetical protein
MVELTARPVVETTAGITEFMVGAKALGPPLPAPPQPAIRMANSSAINNKYAVRLNMWTLSLFVTRLCMSRTEEVDELPGLLPVAT